MQLIGLYIYPIKGARGTHLREATVVARGLEHDRRFMVVDADGVFITQRHNAKMALIHPTLVNDTIIVGDVRIPIDPDGPRRSVRVWSSIVDAIDVSAEASQYISSVIGADASLVYMPDDARRSVSDLDGRDSLVSFADAYPFLMTSEASRVELQRHIAEPIPMERFRPNLIIDGDVAWEEDGWARIRIGEIDMDMPKGCERCVVTTIDQQTAKASKEPLATLGRMRKRNGKVWFGENLVHRGTGTLRVGDPVTVVQRR